MFYGNIKYFMFSLIILITIITIIIIHVCGDEIDCDKPPDGLEIRGHQPIPSPHRKDFCHSNQIQNTTKTGGDVDRKGVYEIFRI